MFHQNSPNSCDPKKRFNDRKAAMSIVTISLLLLAGVSSTLGTTYFYIMNKDKVPAAQITNLASDQTIQAGPVEIRGTAAGEPGEIQAILVKVDKGPTVFATPRATDDFSSWSALVEVPTSGTHDIEVEVVDAEGKTHSMTQSVTITEPAPSLAPPPHQIVEATRSNGAYANYPVPEVRGDKTGIKDPECSPASGSLFPMGISEVACVAYRADGSALVANFTLSVRDSTPPSIEPPKDVIRKNSGNSVANGWLGKPSVSDIVDDSPIISNDVPFYGFPIGTTAVVWTATDDYGNFAQAVQMVTITSETIVGEADGSNSTSGSGTTNSGNSRDGSSGSSVTYGNGGGGGGGGGSSKGNGKPAPPSSGSSGNTSAPHQTKLVTKSMHLDGSPRTGMFTTIKSSSGATLLSGHTPLTFIGTGNATYTVTISDNNTAVFHHWEDGLTSATRSVTLSQNTTITAYYDNATTPSNDTILPSVTITNPANGATVELGTLAVQGTSSDNNGGSGISTLQVRLDGGSYITATPKSAGDWSSWTGSVGALAAGQHTIHVKATDNAGNHKEVSVVINVASSPGDTNAPTVLAAPLGGTYSAAKSITLSASEPAIIYYTTNGNTPTTLSQVYSSPISISTTTTLKFMARDTAGNVGVVTSQSYIIDMIAPSVTASVSSGTYGTPQSVSLSANEPATIFYTTNGNAPSVTSSVYGSPITISSTTTLKYFARDAAGNTGSITTQVYTIDTSLPTVTASPPGGLYSLSKSVTLTTSKPATIYYTTNGNTPTTSSQVYSSPISISSTSSLKYFARDAAGNAGSVVTQVYTIDTTPPTVTASPTGGTYSSSKSVTLSANEQATIYYTTNGNTPTTASAIFSSPISIAATTTLKFMARDTAGNVGVVTSQSYVIDTTNPTVTASPPGGTFASARSVTLSASEPAIIYYTTNGNTPTTLSQVYSSPISVSSTTLKYFARDLAGNTGTISTQTYSVDAAAPTVTASPSGGIFASTTSVTLTASESATIYYTTNGNTPTTSSQVYSSPISISSTSSLKYFARDAAGNAGSVVTQVYTINAVDITVPSIAITQPAKDSIVTVAGGQLVVTGTASDTGSGINTVEVRVDDGSYATATPGTPGDWSTWSVTLSVTAGQHRLVPRATDEAGNRAWNSIYVTVNDSSVPPPPPPPDPDPNPDDSIPNALRTVNVNSISSLTAAIAASIPGDHIVVANGAYSLSSTISITRDGTASDPIVITAQSIGGVELTGARTFSLSGAQHVIIRGFDFTYNQDSAELTCNDCSNVRFTSNTFLLTTTSKAESDWLTLTGTSNNNRIDNNRFEHKNSLGSFVILRGEGSEVVKHNLIDHNYFHDHTNADGNGGECITMGYSGWGPSSGFNTVEYNTFEQCNGDAEIITVKSSDNMIRYNTFRNNQGSLVFRHGSDNTADGNIFIDGPNGIRAYGANQKIINNYFGDNPTSGASVKTALIIGRGNVADDLATANAGYSHAKNILIAHNTFVNNQGNIVIGGFSGSYIPEDITIANNIVTGSRGQLVDVIAGDVTFDNNILAPTGSATVGDVPTSGYTNVNPQLVDSGDIMRPSSSSPAVDAVSSSETYGVNRDLDGETRSGMCDIGADEV